MATAVLTQNELEWKDVVDASLVKLTATADILSLSSANGDVELRGVKDPTQDSSSATKRYVDSVALGIQWSGSCRVISTTNGALSTAYANGQTVDGVVLVTGDCILLAGQTDAIQNGMWTVAASGAPSRSPMMAVGSSAKSKATFIEEGSTYADSAFVCTNDSGSDIVGTNPLTFVQFTGLGQVLAGAGLEKLGNTLSVNVDDSTTEISADQVIVKDSGISASKLASDSVTTVKILDANVTNSKLQNDSVTVSAGSALSTTSASIALGSAASLSVNVDDVGVEVSSDALQLKDLGVKLAKVDFGTGAGQIDTADLPLNTHTYTSISAPSQAEDAIQKLDAKITDIVGGGSGVQMSNGVCTTGGTGFVDVRFDNSTIEADSANTATNVLRLKDAGITDSKIANATISNSKLVNDSITINSGDGLQTGGTVALGSSVTVDVDSTVVRTIGSQSIAGIKTFLNEVRIPDESAIKFGTGQDMTISHDGSQSTILHDGTGDLVIDNDNTTGSTVMKLGTDTLATEFKVANSSNSSLMTVDGSGFVSLSNTTQSTASSNGALVCAGGVGVAKDLRVAGNAYALSHTATSDETKKENINLIENATDIINQINPISYQWKPEVSDDRRLNYGVSAQQIRDIIPDAVYESKSGLSVNYNNILTLLLKSHQELAEQVRILQN